MTFQNTVLALLAIVIFAVAAHEMRAQVRAAEHGEACSHRAHSEDSVRPPAVRVVRIARSALIESLYDSQRVAQLLGLESRGSFDEQRALAAVAFGDASHAVVQVQDRGRLTQLVVLAE